MEPTSLLKRGLPRPWPLLFKLNLETKPAGLLRRGTSRDKRLLTGEGLKGLEGLEGLKGLGGLGGLEGLEGLGGWRGTA